MGFSVIAIYKSVFLAELPKYFLCGDITITLIP